MTGTVVFEGSVLARGPVTGVGRAFLTTLGAYQAITGDEALVDRWHCCLVLRRLCRYCKDDSAHTCNNRCIFPSDSHWVYEYNGGICRVSYQKQPLMH